MALARNHPSNRVSPAPRRHVKTGPALDKRPVAHETDDTPCAAEVRDFTAAWRRLRRRKGGPVR
jgi:hypothetical protein